MTYNPNHIDPLSPVYLDLFCKAARGLIKTLVRARATQEPTYLSAKDYERLGVTGLETEGRSCAQLLTHVRQLLAQFEHRFPLIQGSVSEPHCLEESDKIEILAERVAGFIFGDLDEAIRIAAKGKKVSWDSLANWAELTSLRDALDRLPKAVPTNPAGVQATARSRQVILFGLRDKPIVNGKEKLPLTLPLYKLIKAIIEAGEVGLRKSTLLAISSDYWKSLKALTGKDKDWGRVIHFPGKTGRGIWID